jgi:hypothetical protein
MKEDDSGIDFPHEQPFGSDRFRHFTKTSMNRRDRSFQKPSFIFPVRFIAAGRELFAPRRDHHSICFYSCLRARQRKFID